MLHSDRLFPVEPRARELARSLYAAVRERPIISPHGHTDPVWFAENRPFADATELLLKPDHYLLRMLYSQGLSMAELGRGPAAEKNNALIWQRFAERFHLFAGTPTSLWFLHTLSDVFDWHSPLNAGNAQDCYAAINAALARPEFRPRALLDRFRIAFLATTESPLDDLRHHQALQSTALAGRVVTTFRPDPVLDPATPGFAENLRQLGDITDIDVGDFAGYLHALRRRRKDFQALGATATDHGHPSAKTADLDRPEAERLYGQALRGEIDATGAEVFRAHMLTEMAAMSCDDGMVMQLHPGVVRNHNLALWKQCGAEVGGDIPQRTDFVQALKPLLNRFGNRRDFRLIVFTVDESAYARELAPLAGHYPALLLGPPWWFHDSPEGMLRYRQQITETAGFYNTAGFNDDTRAFFSIPARHDVARRMDARFLATWVAEHRITESQAYDLIGELTDGLVRRAYRIPDRVVVTSGSTSTPFPASSQP